MSDTRAGGRNRLLTGAAWAALLLALCLFGSGTTDDEPGTENAPPTTRAAATGRPPAHGLPPVHEPLPGAGPLKLSIKAIGLQAPVEGHGLDPLGGVEAPPYDRANSVAWYQEGPQPGTPGAAVIVGHVDTQKAPAVFAGLSILKRGNKIRVDRTDGITAEFTIDDISLVPNDQFDADKVYGPREQDRAELRLITCGGVYDRTRRAYNANLVVSAYLTGSETKEPPAGSPAEGPPRE
ncbi:class F sortase [Streptomyces sp. ISL-11]|uniref:class F sortase n=1 Tax=Streptomyces sp. ISL-11 TaxID=2819174 RepID=UPI001BEA39BE|nr:class F sortase [Streptomyces sp. ISL-11]MBT2387250.1 class F sortase [Streptomyces sp. ISL-11]